MATIPPSAVCGGDAIVALVEGLSDDEEYVALEKFVDEERRMAGVG
jgi:hypothetical protein